MKKFMFSAVALIGFTVASYGANESENLVLDNTQTQLLVLGTCEDVADAAYNRARELGLSHDDAEAYSIYVYLNCKRNITPCNCN